MEAYSDRSRLLAYQHCPRQRYFEYEIPTNGEVPGVVSTKLDLDLLVGSCFHRGVEGILIDRKHGSEPLYTVDDAVKLALDEFWDAVKTRGGILGEGEDAYYVYNEHAALVEALVRGWEKFSLPQLLDRYVIVEVEEEYLGLFEIPGFKLHFGARVDALLMEKDTLDLHVLSLKTTKEWGKKPDDEARHDMQGLSETEVVDQKLRRWHEELSNVPNQEAGWEKAVPHIPKWFIDRSTAGAAPQVAGVKMEFALKGRKSEYPEGSGRYSYSNPLIRPWKKDDGLNSTQWAFKWEVKDDFGHSHRLGKGWLRVNIWEDIGVKAWIDILASETIQGFAPGTGIAGQFVLPMEYYRNDEDIADMKIEVAFQEKRIAEARRALRLGMVDRVIKIGYPDTHDMILREQFPKHRKSCDWPKKCAYQDICYGPKAYVHDPISSQIYQIRTPNHPIEIELTKSQK